MGLSNEEIWTMRNVLWYKITFLDKFVFSLLFFPFEALIRVSTDSLFSCLRESLRMQYVNFILRGIKENIVKSGEEYPLSKMRVSLAWWGRLSLGPSVSCLTSCQYPPRTQQDLRETISVPRGRPLPRLLQPQQWPPCTKDGTKMAEGRPLKATKGETVASCQ